MSFAEAEDDEDEKWLQEPKIDSPVQDWRGHGKPKKRAFRPIRVSQRKKACGHCGQQASVELFRDGKCLACQVSDFLGPL